MSVNQSQRKIVDALLQVATALPAAGATANGTSIDLYISGTAGLGNATLEKMEIGVKVDACPNLTDTTKSVTVTIQDSEDNSSFTAIAQLAALVIPGVASTGASATEPRYRLPSTTRRYVRASAAVTSGGGSNIASNFTLTLYA